jgi:glycosyltransferase involved in cell wall biosynthesis
MNPRVSVIIPTYNREKLILKSIDSVLKQSFQDLEILIIDDASSDNTESVIRSFGNEKIRYFKLDKNSGQCVARNYGIGKARGEYIAFLDSDDEWLPDKLKLQIGCFEKGSGKTGAVYGGSYKRDVVNKITTFIDKKYFRGNINDKFLEGFCPPTPSLFLVKKSVLQEVNGFDEELLTFVDLDLWLRISGKYHFDFVEDPVIIKYEQIGDQYINNFPKRYKGYKLFMQKWQDEIIRYKGKKGLMKFKSHMIYALAIPILENPPDNIRPQIPKLLRLLLKIRSRRFNLYTKALMIFVFGPGIIYKVRNLKS